MADSNSPEPPVSVEASSINVRFIERFFSKLKCYRRIATRYDKLGMNFLAMTKLACIRLTLRHNEPRPNR